VPDWPLKKWLLLTLVFVCLQVVFFAVLLDKKKIVSALPSVVQNTQMIPQAGLKFNPILLSYIESFDPRIFSYAHPLGVSAFLWQESPTTEYHLIPPPLPPLTVAPDTFFFQRELSSLLLENTAQKDILENVYSRSPKIREPLTRDPIERSTLHFPEEISQHWLIPEVELPVLLHSGALAQTELSVTFGSDGRVFSATLIASCGVAAADEQAVQIISSLRLLPQTPKPKPESPQSDVWAHSKTVTLTVEWATSPPKKNNR